MARVVRAAVADAGLIIAALTVRFLQCRGPIRARNIFIHSSRVTFVLTARVW